MSSVSIDDSLKKAKLINGNSFKNESLLPKESPKRKQAGRDVIQDLWDDDFLTTKSNTSMSTSSSITK
jgi:hypothetical protein